MSAPREPENPYSSTAIKPSNGSGGRKGQQIGPFPAVPGLGLRLYRHQSDRRCILRTCLHVSTGISLQRLKSAVRRETEGGTSFLDDFIPWHAKRFDTLL